MSRTDYEIVTKKNCKYMVFQNVIPRFTMGDGRLILPALVIKIIPPSPGVSRVFRERKLNVEYKYIGFVLAF